MYKVLKDFRDLRDGGYEYHKGDIYPHSGKADAKRVEILSSPTPERGALIKEVKEEKKSRKAEK